jgi:hypothetical protein
MKLNYYFFHKLIYIDYFLTFKELMELNTNNFGINFKMCQFNKNVGFYLLILYLMELFLI